MTFCKQVLALGLVAAIAACSGATPTIVPSAANGASAPGLAHSVDPTTAVASITIQWPKNSNKLGVVIEATGTNDKSTITIVNRVGASGSTTVKAQTPVGNDTFVISLYDQPQKSGEKQGAGNQLGQAVIARTIVANKTNVVKCTIDGTIGLIGIAVASPSPLASVIGKPGAQNLQLVGDEPTTVTLTPLDADGNAVLSSTGRLQYRLQSSGGTGPVLRVNASTKQRDSFSVTPVAPIGLFQAEQQLALVATITDALGPHTANFVVSLLNEVFVGYTGGQEPRIAAYGGNGKLLNLPSGAFSGVTQPEGLAYDRDDHWLFVADASGKVLAFDPQGGAVSQFKAPTISGMTAIAYYNDKFGRIATKGLKTNPRRVLVADSQDGFDELAMSGARIVSAGSTATASGTAYTPTAIAGAVDDVGPSKSGAIVIVADPVGKSIDAYDMNDPNPSHTGTPLQLPDANTLYQDKVPVAIAAVPIEEEAGDVSGGCPAGTSPVNLVLVTTGTVGQLNYFAVDCGNGVYAVNATPPSLGKNLTGIAYDMVNGGYYAVDTTDNAVVDYIAGIFGTFPTINGTGSFDTPITTGMLTPTSIAVAF